MNIHFPLILDGAMGTQLQKHGMPVGVCPEKWILNNEEIALEIQKAYIEAGSQIIYAPTFGANSVCLESHGIFNKVEDYNERLVNISKTAANGKALVAGDISSTGTMLYPLGNMSFQDLYDVYYQQASALEKAGVDLFVIETMTNVAEARAAVLAVKDVSKKPVFVSFTCDENGRTMMGTDVCSALLIMQNMGVDAFGLNCSVGPNEMAKQIERLNKYAFIPLIAKANAGLPTVVDGHTIYSLNAEEYVKAIPSLVKAGTKIFGSCCGSDETYIKLIKETLKQEQLVDLDTTNEDLIPLATEKEAFLLDPSIACTQVFVCDEDLEDNITSLDEDELFGIEINNMTDVATFADVQYLIKNPLCIICDDITILEKALQHYQGLALYEGNLKTDDLIPLAEKYGLII